MSAALALLGLILLSLGVFWIEEIWVLIALVLGFMATLIITMTLRHSWRMLGRTLLRCLIFMLFIFLCNLIFYNLELALIILLRLFVVLLATQTFLRFFELHGFVEALRILLLPLSKVGVDTDELVLVVAIAVNFIPILSDEAKTIQQALNLKGYRFSFRSCLFHPQIFLEAYFKGLFERMTEVELALLLKGYE